jgi:osmotically-inducible protein OsmY
MHNSRDNQIRQHIDNALRYNPLTRDAPIAIYVKDGIAALHGAVDSHAQKIAVERTVKGIAGVRGFAESLRVTPPHAHKRSDQDLARAALHALQWNALVPDERVQVKVEDGWLTLLGNVTWQVERRAAADAVAHLPGLRGMTNRIVLIPQAKPADVRATIDQALSRGRASAAHAVEIVVDGATVTLRGAVSSWEDYEEAEHAAWSCPGISDVRNLLIVQSPLESTMPTVNANDSRTQTGGVK